MRVDCLLERRDCRRMGAGRTGGAKVDWRRGEVGAVLLRAL